MIITYQVNLKLIGYLNVMIKKINKLINRKIFFKLVVEEGEKMEWMDYHIKKLINYRVKLEKEVGKL
jgi:hypothetical protein